jgi:hypothetical protein
VRVFGVTPCHPGSLTAAGFHCCSGVVADAAMPNITKTGGIVKLKIDTAGGSTNVANTPGQRGAEMPTVPGKSLCSCEHL